MFGRISLGNLGTLVGSILTVVGFVAYATDNATLNLAGFFYGIPLLLGGLALKSAELKPTPYSRPTSAEVAELRSQQATPTQLQIGKDVTRYRYGQDVHLEVALDRLGLNYVEDERPRLQALREEAIAGAYALVLEFESIGVPFAQWQERQAKIEAFFGPNVRAQLSQPEEDVVELALVAVVETAD